MYCLHIVVNVVKNSSSQPLIHSMTLIKSGGEELLPTTTNELHELSNYYMNVGTGASLSHNFCMVSYSLSLIEIL
jgi:hypothetical protein